MHRSRAMLGEGINSFAVSRFAERVRRSALGLPALVYQHVWSAESGMYWILYYSQSYFRASGHLAQTSLTRERDVASRRTTFPLGATSAAGCPKFS